MRKSFAIKSKIYVFCIAILARQAGGSVKFLMDTLHESRENEWKWFSY